MCDALYLVGAKRFSSNLVYGLRIRKWHEYKFRGRTIMSPKKSNFDTAS